jgi:hypothetical protein
MRMVIVGGRNCGKTLALERMVELAKSLGKNFIIVHPDYPMPQSVTSRIVFDYGKGNVDTVCN